MMEVMRKYPKYNIYSNPYNGANTIWSTIHIIRFKISCFVKFLLRITKSSRYHCKKIFKFTQIDTLKIKLIKHLYIQNHYQQSKCKSIGRHCDGVCLIHFTTDI